MNYNRFKNIEEEVVWELGCIEGDDDWLLESIVGIIEVLDDDPDEASIFNIEADLEWLGNGLIKIVATSIKSLEELINRLEEDDEDD